MAESEVRRSLIRNSSNFLIFPWFAYFIWPFHKELDTLKEVRQTVICMKSSLFLGWQSACFRHKGAVALRVTWTERTHSSSAVISRDSAAAVKDEDLCCLQLNLQTYSLKHRQQARSNALSSPPYSHSHRYLKNTLK